VGVVEAIKTIEVLDLNQRLAKRSRFYRAARELRTSPCPRHARGGGADR
jgi:hypothetical protein